MLRDGGRLLVNLIRGYSCQPKKFEESPNARRGEPTGLENSNVSEAMD
jgi:hypothetical protein